MVREKHSTIITDGEIDLITLIKTLWQKKWVILGITLLSTLIGILYLSFTKPIYEAKAYIYPPSLADIVSFNYGRSDDFSSLHPFSIEDVYNVFLGNLLAESTKEEFFKTVFLPSRAEGTKQKSPHDALYNAFNKILTIKESSKTTPTKYLMIVRGNNPTQIVAWLKQYLALAQQKAQSEMISNIEHQNIEAARTIQNKIEQARVVAKNKRFDHLTQLKEALKIAKVVNITERSVFSLNGTMTDASSFNEPSMMYLRGTKVLQVEIENLSTRDSDDAFVEGLRELEGEYRFYKNITINSQNIAMFRLDGKVNLPDLPILPQKRVVFLLSILLGMMLGIILVIGQNFFQRK